MEWYVWLLIFLIIAALAYITCNIWEVFFIENAIGETIAEEDLDETENRKED